MISKSKNYLFVDLHYYFSSLSHYINNSHRSTECFVCQSMIFISVIFFDGIEVSTRVLVLQAVLHHLSHLCKFKVWL
jgi:hypothetical protein